MIKLIALLTMLIDHSGRIFFSNEIIFLIIGRISLPLFAWGIAMGFRRTSNFNRYALRLLMLGLVSQIPYYYLFNNMWLNVCFTLLSGLLVLRIITSKINLLYKILIVTGISIFTDIFLEYGLYAIALIVVFYYFDKSPYLIIIITITTMLGIYIYKFSSLQFFAVLSVFIIIFLRKFDLKLNKKFLYTFYPLHLTILLIISIVTI